MSEEENYQEKDLKSNLIERLKEKNLGKDKYYNLEN